MAASGKGGSKTGVTKTANTTTVRREDARSRQTPSPAVTAGSSPDSRPKRPKPLDLSSFKRRGIL